MGPDRIRAWLKRAPKAAERVQAVLQQLGATDVVMGWDLDELRHGDGARAICDALQDHCDGLEAPARYSLQMLDSNATVIVSRVVRATPNLDDDDDDEEDDDGKRKRKFKVEDASIAGVLAQILRHQEAMARMYIGSQGGVLRNMQDMLELQAGQIKELAGQLKVASQRARAAEARAENETAEAENEETIARANAITKIGEAVASQLIPVVAARMNGAAS